MNSNQKELSTKNAVIVESKEHLLEVLTHLENDEDIEGIYKGRSNPNRQTEAYLVLDGNIKNIESYKEDLCSRFDAFNTAYKECMERCNRIKNIISEKAVDFEVFAVQYAIGVLLSSFEMKLYGIIAQGTGIMAASVLTGKINLNQALEEIFDIRIMDNYDTSDNNKNAVYLNCPILTSLGVLEDILNIYKNGDENIKSLNGFVNKNQVIIYPGSINEIKNKEFYDDKLFHWIEMDINRNRVKSIMIAFAKLYTLGIRFNPGKFFKGNVKKVMLPTYPFENETYKVSFEEELTYKEADSVLVPQRGLLKMEMKHTLSDNEKKLIFNQLNNDIVK